MEPLAYIELTVAYEESGGCLERQTRPKLHPLSFQKIVSWAAIASLILLGGFGAALSTAFSDRTPAPNIDRPIAPR
ncbi:hypothetical protein [Oscillatoria sp. FACHB-1406]|uniref:hypothetical protein n=1 Tax=Oscillatoria sp. FACHB-1406 TaxID=2692846 RepID=UPI001686E4B9|nr:hypothetical protein [Oscillatoria sp. FACHB-1406]MBD2580607.1 hypothetical protein [Oscillatoria sp. FACHB-1406]